MVSLFKLLMLYNLTDLVVKNKIEGDLVECGCWKGGSSAIIGYLGLSNNQKRLWLFDSFAGLPNPTISDGIKTGKMFKAGKIDKCIGNVKDIQLIMNRFGIDMKRLVITKGWFQDTLPKTKNQIKSIGLLHIDADWYDSVKIVLENLYDSVIKNGIIIIDDYGIWEGCKKAVDEFFTKRNIVMNGKSIQGAYYFKK